jgi:hypothetical protein
LQRAASPFKDPSGPVAAYMARRAAGFNAAAHSGSSDRSMLLAWIDIPHPILIHDGFDLLHGNQLAALFHVEIKLVQRAEIENRIGVWLATLVLSQNARLLEVFNLETAVEAPAQLLSLMLASVCADRAHSPHG